MAEAEAETLGKRVVHQVKERAYLHTRACVESRHGEPGDLEEAGVSAPRAFAVLVYYTYEGFVDVEQIVRDEVAGVLARIPDVVAATEVLADPVADYISTTAFAEVAEGDNFVLVVAILSDVPVQLEYSLHRQAMVVAGL